MTLADRLHEAADDIELPRLAEPSEILRAGDRLRARSRRRAVLAVAAAVVLVVAASANLGSTERQSAPLPAKHIDGWRVVRSLDVPGNGGVLYADGSLWVIDNKDTRLTADGTAPAGEMYQIDPSSGDVLDRIPGAVGGWQSAGGGNLYLSTLAGDLNVLTRVNTSSRTVARFETSRPKQPPHGSAFVAGSLWIANTESGDLVKMDPNSGRVARTVHVGDLVKGEAPYLPKTDGESVWVSTDDGVVLRYDGVTGANVSRLQTPMRELRLVGSEPGRRNLYAVGGYAHNSLFEISMDAEGDWEGRELALSQAPNRSFVTSVAASRDAIWVVTGFPDELLRIDPLTFRVTDRMPLAGLDHESDVSADLWVGGGALWVRSKDKVLELRPES